MCCSDSEPRGNARAVAGGSFADCSTDLGCHRDGEPINLCHAYKRNTYYDMQLCVTRRSTARAGRCRFARRVQRALPTHDLPRPRYRRAATKLLPQLERIVETAEHAWNEFGVPEATRLQAEIGATNREPASLQLYDLMDRMDDIQVGGPSRRIGRDRALDLCPGRRAENSANDRR